MSSLPCWSPPFTGVYATNFIPCEAGSDQACYLKNNCNHVNNSYHGLKFFKPMRCGQRYTKGNPALPLTGLLNYR